MARFMGYEIFELPVPGELALVERSDPRTTPGATYQKRTEKTKNELRKPRKIKIAIFGDGVVRSLGGDLKNRFRKICNSK